MWQQQGLIPTWDVLSSGRDCNMYNVVETAQKQLPPPGVEPEPETQLLNAGSLPSAVFTLVLGETVASLDFGSTFKTVQDYNTVAAVSGLQCISPH